jgi:hypothetical protein
MNVFLSSVITGMEDARDNAGEAIIALGHNLIRAEDFGASPRSPQQTCLEGVRGADVVVLVLGARYGFAQPSGLSATHEEYREAKVRCDVLVFVQRDIEREPEQDTFVQEAQSWNAGQYTEPFSTPEELRRLITRRLRELELARQAGQPDEMEMHLRAEALIPSTSETYRDALFVTIAGGPRQQVLRPSEIESVGLQKMLVQEALFGTNSIFTHEEATRTEVAGHLLRISQERASLLLDEQGSIRIVQPAATQDERAALSALIQEEVVERTERSLRFAGWVLDQVDGPRRLTDVVPIAGILNASYMPWRTRREHELSPNSATMSQAGERIVVNLAPLSRKRATLLNDAPSIAEDLMVLLRRQMRRG